MATLSNMTTSADLDNSPTGNAFPCIHQPAGFLSIPRELRDEIYKYVLHKPQSTITMLSHHYAYRAEISAEPPALTSVNRQLRDETLPVFYGENSFMAEVCSRLDLDTAQRWLEAIGDENIAHLRSLSLCSWSCVQIGVATVRQWIRADLDLKTGNFDIRAPTQDDHPRLSERVCELKAAFHTLLKSLSGADYDVKSLGQLLRGFHSLCFDSTNYARVDRKCRFADDDGSLF